MSGEWVPLRPGERAEGGSRVIVANGNEYRVLSWPPLRGSWPLVEDIAGHRFYVHPGEPVRVWRADR